MTTERLQRFRFVVTAEDKGRRLDQVLAARIPGLSRRRARVALDLGGVFVDGARTKVAGRLLRAGQVVVANLGGALDRASKEVGAEARARDEAALPAFRVVHQDDDLVVVDKPSGLLTAPTPESDRNNLASALSRMLGREASVVLRLDMETSGLLVFALGDEANRVLAERFREHDVERVYLAVLRGVVAEDAHTSVELRRSRGGAPSRTRRRDRALRRGRRDARAETAAWRPGARTRSGCTRVTSGIRCWATGGTGSRRRSIRRGWRCTRRCWGSRIRAPGKRCGSRAGGRRIWRRGEWGCGARREPTTPSPRYTGRPACRSRMLAAAFPMSAALQDGAVFAGRYRILRCIATGGMGAVYEVLHLETERRRALKVMLPHVLQSDDLRERFKREAKVAAQIESDFIVDVFDAGVDEATKMPFLVMELLKGEELGKRLKRIGKLAPADVVAHMHQTALALDKTHRAAIVHRDLKPENLFLTDREEGPPRIKVLDFGIAKIVAESATAGATQSIGTPLYMAPEQFNPASRLTGAADIYALGMVTFTLLAGKAYWAEEARGGNIFALANVAMRGPSEPASVRAARRGVPLPPAFDAWFAQITATDPAQRFPTATEAVRALGEALGFGRSATPSLVDSTGFPPTSGQGWPAVASGPVATPAPPAMMGSAPAMTTLPASALVTAPATGPITAPGMSSAAQPPPRPSRAGLVVGAALAGGALLGLVIYLGVHRTPAPVAAVQPTVASEALSVTPTPAPSATSAASEAAHVTAPAAPEHSASAPPSSGSASGSASAPPSAASAAVKPAVKKGVPTGSRYSRD